MKRILLITIAGILIFANGCISVKPKEAREALKRDYLIYDIGKIPSELEMLKNENIRQMDLLPLFFEGLVKYSGVNEKTGADSIVPGIAESWIISGDGTKYTFKIRENALWSDGSRITAYDFVDFFNEILSPKKENIFDYELMCISGAKEYREGKNKNRMTSIKALDSNMLEIKLDYQCSYFIETLAEPIYCIRKLDGSLKSFSTNYKNICYSGPFKIQSIGKNDEVVLQADESYWNKDNVKSSKILITSSGSSEESYVKFKKNDIDVFFNPPESEIEELSQDESLEAVPSIKASYIVFNFNDKTSCKDADLRKAVAIASDKARTSDSNNKLSTAEAFAFKPSVTSGSEKDKNFNCSLKFVFEDTKTNRGVCKGVAEAAEKTFGIKISLFPCDMRELRDKIKSGDYDMAKLDLEGDYRYPITVLQKLVSKSAFNSFGYSNKVYDKLMDWILKEQKENLRIQYIQKAEDILSKDIPIIPLYYYDTVLCKNNNAIGINITKKGNIILDKAYLKLP